MGILSLILGIITLAIFWSGWYAIICGIITIIFAIFGLNKAKKAGEIQEKRISIAGLIAGITGLIIAISVFVLSNRITAETSEISSKVTKKTSNWNQIGENTVDTLNSMLRIEN